MRIISGRRCKKEARFGGELGRNLGGRLWEAGVGWSWGLSWLDTMADTEAFLNESNDMNGYVQL